MPGEIQRSFSAGEVSPTLYGRADIDRWGSALHTCRNWAVEPEGGLTTRQGFELVARIPWTTNSKHRLLPFEYGPSDSYLIICNGIKAFYIRNGVLATGGEYKGGGIDADARIVCVDHGYSTGDTVVVYNGVAAGTYTITVISSMLFSLDGTPGTGGGYSPCYFRRTALVGGGTQQYSQTLEYSLQADAYLGDSDKYLTFAQSGDVIFMACEGERPRTLTRGEDPTQPTYPYFTLANYNGIPTRSGTTVATTHTVTGTGSAQQNRYIVTSTDANGIESSACGRRLIGTVSGTTTLTVTTSRDHLMITGDTIYLDLGWYDSNGDVVHPINAALRVTVTGATTFTVTGGASGLGVSGGISFFVYTGSAMLNAPETNPITVAWTAVAGTNYYNVYKEYGRVYGYIGSTPSLSFVDNGIIPDVRDTPVLGLTPFEYSTSNAIYNTPRAIGIFQQRILMGGYGDDIERIRTSHVGNYYSFEQGAEDSSGVDFSLGGRTVSGVLHFVEAAGRAVVLSDTAEWVLRGGTSGAITPTAINARVDSYHGSSEVAPCLIGTAVIYLQRGDRVVREAVYDFGQEALTSKDLTLWSKHLFEAGVKKMAYQRGRQTLWCLLNDGTLVAMTYIPEQNVWGWHRHDISGRTISDIAVISEDGDDILYVSCVSGSYIEIGRMPLPWESEDVDDYCGFDMSLAYDGFFTSGYTGTLTGGTAWYTTETLTLTASGSTFVAGDVGKDFLLRSGDDKVYVTCTAYTSGTEISVQARTIVPTTLRATATGDWARCASSFSGLDHLEGVTVGIIADGGVEADQVVASGTITTDRPYARLRAGIKMTQDIKTLAVEASDKDASLGDFKHITRVILRILNSRGLEAGLDEDNLSEMYPEFNPLATITPLLQSGTREILMDATHEEEGSVLIRQQQGLPGQILNARLVFNKGDTR